MSDARNIALTVAATAAAERLKNELNLESVTEAARVGFAYAIRCGLSPTRDGQAPQGSNFNVATIDTTAGALRELVKVFYPDDAEVAGAPYRAIEALMSRGLVQLLSHLNDGTVRGMGDLVVPTKTEGT
jgi:hypothetical protein